ncbi:glycosyl transferase [Vibrio cholerae]|nr:putative glycosyltransferase [Vibrio cholerae]GIA54207.1 glycosyl transferase [Vibrio cholerae]
MNRCFVFRSLPLSADSRISRYEKIFHNRILIYCTWESEHLNDDSFPLKKSGSKLSRVFKYVLFLFWIPFVVIFKAKRNDICIFMDLETVLFGGVVARLFSRTYIFDIVDPFAQTKVTNSYLKSLANRIEYQIANRCENLIVPHQCRIDYYKEQIGRNITNRYLVLENVPALKSVKHRIPACSDVGDIISIGYFGTLDFNSRGIEYLIRVAESNSSIRVYIAGQGAMSQYFESSNLENVVFLGRYAPSDLAELYSRVDFTWAYYSHDNPLHKYAAPNKFYEHLCFAKPIITSEIIPQYRDICQMNSGIAVDADSTPINDFVSAVFDYYRKSDMEKIVELLKESWSVHYSNYYEKMSNEINAFLK